MRHFLRRGGRATGNDVMKTAARALFFTPRSVTATKAEGKQMLYILGTTVAPRFVAAWLAVLQHRAENRKRALEPAVEFA